MNAQRLIERSLSEGGHKPLLPYSKQSLSIIGKPALAFVAPRVYSKYAECKNQRTGLRSSTPPKASHLSAFSQPENAEDALSQVETTSCLQTALLPQPRPEPTMSRGPFVKSFLALRAVRPSASTQRTLDVAAAITAATPSQSLPLQLLSLPLSLPH